MSVAAVAVADCGVDGGDDDGGAADAGADDDGVIAVAVVLIEIVVLLIALGGAELEFVGGVELVVYLQST